MKEKYMKPLLVVERFEVKQSIASDCSVDNLGLDNISFNTIDQCGYKLSDDWIIWRLNIGSECTDNGDLYDYACYNNPEGMAQIFRS